MNSAGVVSQGGVTGNNRPPPYIQTQRCSHTWTLVDAQPSASFTLLQQNCFVSVQCVVASLTCLVVGPCGLHMSPQCWFRGRLKEAMWGQATTAPSQGPVGTNGALPPAVPAANPFGDVASFSTPIAGVPQFSQPTPAGECRFLRPCPSGSQTESQRAPIPTATEL